MRPSKTRELDARYPSSVNLAETLNEFSARTIDAVQRILANSTYRRVTIISHGGVLDCIYRQAKNIDLQQVRTFHILNGSINPLAWDGAQL
ncbi:MAG: histidine phosphatase family protein [Glaciimonas sp.]|nr:histidine phosphatase family protein [Glaciimonas sp.]